MTISNKRSRRKVSGGRYKSNISKRSGNIRSIPRHTKLGKTSKFSVRVNGGNVKSFLLNSDTVNVYNSSDKRHKTVKILEIVSNNANRHFVRRNILTKGAIVKTELGSVRVTSRPGQEG